MSGERCGILELRLEAGSFREQKQFYTEGLELPLDEESAGRFTVQAGETRLTFVEAVEGKPTYHFAFNIPENKLPQAQEWLARRIPVLRQDGREVFHFEDWNAHAFYFHDPAGNVAEFIARHNLRNGAPGPFTAGDILYASEIGLVVDDVPAEVKALNETLGLQLYRPGSERFAPMGDEHHLLILNHRDRGWWEDTPSRPYPVLARLSGGEKSAEYRSQRFPFTIQLQGPGPA
jgi:catechol-2,3-dioxygenase